MADKRGFQPLAEILEKTEAMKIIRSRHRVSDMASIWTQTVGDDVASQTRVGRYKDGKLFVEVASAPLLNELSTYRREELLERLRETGPFRGIVDLVFRSG